MEEWSWRNFTREEMSCKCCGRHILDEDFMNKLQSVRYAYGKPMIVTSGYRCSKHNNKVSQTGLTGVHTTGKAADIKCYGSDAHELLRIALGFGMRGIGVNQSGDHASRFLHFDTLMDESIRPTLW